MASNPKSNNQELYCESNPNPKEKKGELKNENIN